MSEYPTKEELKRIKKFDILKDNVHDFIEFLRSIWEYADIGYFKFYKLKSKKVWKLELHTGGWSGNEDIIYELKKTMFWTVFWEKSIRGGHYYLDIREFKK
jgi:hypothetical protein